MKKSYRKMIASGFLTLISILLMVSVSYAWFTLAGSPALTGVQIKIGGTNTIQIAPDIAETVDGTTIHYPGAFRDTLNVEEHASYSYLNSLYGLTPVSTADGIHWFMPSADSDMDITGEAELSDYTMDNTLFYGNILNTDADGSEKGSIGSYAYVDFWIVSPMDDCNIRLSIGDKEEGSYVIGLPKAIEDSQTGTGYALDEEDQQVSSAVRVGFLVNTDDMTEDLPMENYAESKDYSEDYTKLRGIYQEKGESVAEDKEYQFTIYEPNGDLHTSKGVSLIQSEDGLQYINCSDGDYFVTNPIGYENGNPVLQDISDRLTVQKKNVWKTTDSGELLLSQIFQSSILNLDLEDASAESITDMFYKEEWMSSFSSYVERGFFIRNTQELYVAGNDGVTKSQTVASLREDTTTYHAIIVNLKKNVPQKIRMYVWLEGQDVDCVKETAAEYFAVGIELAGSQQD